MAGARSSCAGFLSSVGCEIRCPIHSLSIRPSLPSFPFSPETPDTQATPYINLSSNLCLVSETDVMEHFAFPGNKDFAADYQGAFHVLFMKGLLCLFIFCETMFTIGKHWHTSTTSGPKSSPREIFHRNPLERERRLQIPREQRRRRRQQQQKEHHLMNFEC